MTSSIVRAGSLSPPDRRAARALARARAQLDMQTDFAIEKVGATVEIEDAKLLAIGHLTQRGQQTVAVLNKFEELLWPADGHQAARMRAVTDAGMFAVSSLLLDAPRRLSK